MSRYFRLTVSLIIAVALASSVLLSAAEMPFKDVSEDSWYYSHVQDAYSAGIMQGKSNLYFAPNSYMTRADFVAQLSLLTKTDINALPDSAGASFTDVEHGSRYSKYIAWALSTGIITGYSDGTFRPNAFITRQEIAVMFSRLLTYSGVSVEVTEDQLASFTDNSSISSWAKQYVNTVKIAGLVEGDINGCYNPLKYATRAEIAAIVCRFYAFCNNSLV